MKDTTWIIIILSVLSFGLLYWGNHQKRLLEQVEQKLQVSEWLVQEYQKADIRNKEAALKNQIESLKREKGKQ